MNDLQEILKRHQAWINEEGGERADLRDMNLRGANLRGVIGNMNEIKSIFVETYPITYISEYLQIGCERHLILEWWEFDSDQIRKMNGDKALEFWGKWKGYIRKIIEMSPAAPTKQEEELKHENQS